MNNSEIILKVQNIIKSYPMGRISLNVLKGLDLSVKKGDFLAIVGSSGSGKSTLLHILGALDKPDSGNVFYQDKCINKFSSAQLNKYRNLTVGFVFQFYHLLDELNIVENVCLPAMAKKTVPQWFAQKKQTKQKALDLLMRFGLKDRLKHMPSQLSGGERQRVAIARALINDPEILLADEPTGNLDSKTGDGILEVFNELNSNGQTIIMVTHDSRIAEKTPKTITIIDGKFNSDHNLK